MYEYNFCLAWCKRRGLSPADRGAWGKARAAYFRELEKEL